MTLRKSTRVSSDQSDTNFKHIARSPTSQGIFVLIVFTHSEGISNKAYVKKELS